MPTKISTYPISRNISLTSAIAMIVLWFAMCSPAAAVDADLNLDCANMPPAETFLYQKIDTIAVRKIQECLRRNGYYTGPINGLKNKMTLAALARSYQRSHQGKATSKPADDTILTPIKSVSKQESPKSVAKQESPKSGGSPADSVKSAATANPDCENLPTKDEFVKNTYDAETVKKFQRCLKSKGVFSGPVHGVKGPLTIRAFAILEEQQKKVASGKQAPNCGPLPTRIELTEKIQDIERIKSIQSCLVSMGLYQGAIDGIKGPLTLEALDRAHGRVPGRAPSKIIKGNNIVVDCEALPTRAEFIAKRLGKSAVSEIQACLGDKGFYSGEIDGVSGPVTLTALDKYHAGNKLKAGELSPDAADVTYRLTGKDIEELMMINDIVEKLQELRDAEFETKQEMVSAIKSAIKEVTVKYDKYDTYLPLILKQADKSKRHSLSENFFSALAEESVSENIIQSLRVLQDEVYDNKTDMIAAIQARLRKTSDPNGYYQSKIIDNASALDSYDLSEQFFSQLEEMRVPENIIIAVQELKNAEYPNKRLFENALDALIRKPMVESGEIEEDEFDVSKPVLTAIARKEHPFDKNKRIRLNGAAGCYLDDLTGVIYGIYPYWLAGEQQKIDFSAITRIGYFALGFDGKGDITDRLDIKQDRSDFINKARQYRTKIDLVIHRNDWSNWSKFISVKRTSFIEKLSINIVNNVTEKLENSFINRIRPYFSLGTSKTPTMADGVTIYFEDYPDDVPAREFYIAFIKELRKRLKSAGKHYFLNVVLPMSSLDKIETLRDEVDLFLIQMDEHTKYTKKEMRLKVEDMFKGKDRRDVMRKIIPMISPRRQFANQVNANQFYDGLIYFEDNFGGVGLWPVPTNKDIGAAELSRTIKSVFGRKGQSDFFQDKISIYTPWFSNFVGPHRWGIRLVFDTLFLILLTYGGLAFMFYELREFFSRHFWWFLGFGLFTLTLQLCLFLADPFWRDKTTGVLFLCLLFAVGFFVWNSVNKLKQQDLP
jgi:peptidoglycan hydrolase-like protein with peptidoglycan-binding domain